MAIIKLEQQAKDFLLTALRELSVNQAGKSGICAHIDWKNFTTGEGGDRKVLLNWMKTQFPLWPEFSGNVEFPVPCEDVDPRVAFLTIPKWSGRYGAARLRLVFFLISRLEKDCE